MALQEEAQSELSVPCMVLIGVIIELLVSGGLLHMGSLVRTHLGEVV